MLGAHSTPPIRLSISHTANRGALPVAGPTSDVQRQTLQLRVLLSAKRHVELTASEDTEEKTDLVPSFVVYLAKIIA